MGGCRVLLLWALVLAAGGSELVYRPGRRVCAVGVPRGPVTESFLQPVYQPFLTTCGGHRACSTYRTIYKTAYRRRAGPAPAWPRYVCCPGWTRAPGLPGACRAAICQPPCQNGGRCVQPGRCHCPAGWQGGSCQTGEARAPGEGPRVASAGHPFPQTWMSAARRGAAVPSGVSTRPGATGASAGRGTAPLRTGRPRAPQEELPGRCRRRCRGCGHGWTCWSRSCSWCWTPCTAWPRGHWTRGCGTPAASWCTPSSSWTASTP
ncbi:epidermal growth factor-like protein 7 isoform X4 [Pipistrellus kuhlii]|uniref:epidermal growth factor-like protein 7 isoform X4 n=1 Tax=Pipistrellus kuhlii TaxID=59472 RepID=UPI00174F4196|nr:epidermal growth factor-like protein 7 isoform X4 [Pipistrellus kuhlii]